MLPTGRAFIPPRSIQLAKVDARPAKEPKPAKWNNTVGKKKTEVKKAKGQKALERKVAVVVETKEKEVKLCEETVTFTQNFNNHILHGEAAGTSHAGYHSESATAFAAFGVCNIVTAADANGVYTADCTMVGRAVPHRSSFFPAGWDIARIRTEVAHAYCHQIDKGGIAGAGALAWVGTSVDGALMIGSSSGLPLNTAFPACNNAFV